MAVEFVLAVTLMWVGPSGEIHSYGVDRQFDSHQACMARLNSELKKIKVMHGANAKPVGVDLCAPRDTNAKRVTVEDLFPTK